ncbi:MULTISPECIES: cytochrome c [unclassified Afipia]|uniref:cytochrome c n=1 Tax=unclassified Afipia TaxID=2642050 RepID=UPI000462FA84|nr:MULTISPECIES: cytochrome c [unclassified Afipia]MAH68196.1 alkylated DNA repair protein [Afipia sp.]OUX62695.1 MAG: alkylated DNA repair protein [Afipia sp. TMED4]HAO41766.1 alkylated DNA repair protein [Afipia sp.]HAP13305.1 alkylated DNA repair protein [Afipia sp.]HAP48701.1 alkylated DNA repair protein [Afipia sp.]
MKLVRIAIMTGLAGITLVAVVFWLVTTPRPRFDRNDQSLEGGNAERGQLVFAAGDCGSCHASPGQSDRYRLGGGMALASPYGLFRIPNISPDERDGIGLWSAADIANAVLSGVSPKGQHYYPAFPYPSFARMDVADVKDLAAFLKTLPKVSGRAPPHDLSLVFKLRRTLGLWKSLYLHQDAIVRDVTKGDAWNRGRYLADSIAHCAECHSTRNLLGAIKPSEAYAGGLDPEGVGYIPNITPAAIGDWTVAQITEILNTGVTPTHGPVGSSMADVVTNTAMMPQSDREAIAIYIKSLPARPTPKP